MTSKMTLFVLLAVLTAIVFMSWQTPTKAESLTKDNQLQDQEIVIEPIVTSNYADLFGSEYVSEDAYTDGEFELGELTAVYITTIIERANIDNSNFVVPNYTGFIGKPCTPSAKFYITGHRFDTMVTSEKYGTYKHNGLDGTCSDGLAAAPADAVVWTITDENPGSWYSDGRTVVLKTIVPGDATYYFVFGHTAYDKLGEFPEAGMYVGKGNPIAQISNTGVNVFGVHLHYVIIRDDGSGWVYLDPELYGAN